MCVCVCVCVCKCAHAGGEQGREGGGASLRRERERDGRKKGTEIEKHVQAILLVFFSPAHHANVNGDFEKEKEIMM
jgi:hypothetical protein